MTGSLVRWMGLLLLTTFLSWASLAMAAVYQAEGMASLGAGREAAREMAIDDALSQIAVSHGGRLLGVSELGSQGLAESSLLGPKRVPGRMTVISEREGEQLLYVTVSLDTAALSSESAAAQPAAVPASAAATDICAAGALPPGRFLKRRALSTFFAVNHPQQSSGLGDISHWLPAELARRLSEHANVTGLDGGRYTLFAPGVRDEPLAGLDSARALGLREDVQFVVAGQVVDSQVTAQAPRVSLFGVADSVDASITYNGPFAGFLGASMRVAPVARQFSMDVWLYDGFSGALLARERLSGVARGDVAPSSARSFTPYSLAGSDYGRMISGLLDQAVEHLTANMTCLPFTSRVVRVEGGKVYLGAGAVDGLAVGDRLLVYRQQPDTRIRAASGEVLGVPEVLLGDVSITQVQPRLAIGIMNGGRLPQTGDLARFPRRF
ncbi:flagellar assembly protein T N-terminal domain-containing protein [Craterilacuibacter sp.]|uniref:flagellar assembly protein T N-terminal domain-containing protein n=1 Tax=Craterilacuibacter sp. TaxID=2870909 RepID=UPI003F41AED5